MYLLKVEQSFDLLKRNTNTGLYFIKLNKCIQISKSLAQIKASRIVKHVVSNWFYFTTGLGLFDEPPTQRYIVASLESLFILIRPTKLKQFLITTSRARNENSGV